MDDERMEAYDRVDRYYEIMGYDPPPTSSEEYRERFHNALEDIREGK
jgi:hypothetical protein